MDKYYLTVENNSGGGLVVAGVADGGKREACIRRDHPGCGGVLSSQIRGKQPRRRAVLYYDHAAGLYYVHHYVRPPYSCVG